MDPTAYLAFYYGYLAAQLLLGRFIWPRVGCKIMSISNTLSTLSRKFKPSGPATDPFQSQREQLSKSIIPGKTRLMALASEQAGGATAVGGAFGVGSQTPTFQAEREEEQTGRRFNRRAGQDRSNQRIAGRNGLGAAFGRF